MFVETKREGEAPVKTEPGFMSIESLIVWLETKDPNKTFCYAASGHCLIAQYIQAHGHPHGHCGPYNYSLTSGQSDQKMPKGFNRIAQDSSTFGEALEMAKAWIR